jgi:hypothetical protein
MTALFLLDVRVDPVSSFSWGGLIVLLLFVFALAVSLVAGLVFFLLWTQSTRKGAQRSD